MEKIVSFLRGNIEAEFEIRRLEDRSKRRNLDIHRKNVYLVTSGPQKYILLHFSNKYRAVFLNFISAREVLGKLIQGEKWVIDKENLLILLPYFGSNFNRPDKGMVKKIIDYLINTHQPTRFHPIELPRYLSDLLDVEDRQFQFTHLKNLISTLKSKKLSREYGPGIKDPAFNNFVDGVDIAYLVDLDNFSTDINLDYELGFLSADIFLEFQGQRYDQSDMEQITVKKIDRIMFDIGYASRLATIVLDYGAGEPVQKSRIIEVHQIIEDLSNDLLRILE